MSPGVPTKVIGACCGLTAFAIATIAGLVAGNAAEVVLGRALVCMLGCQAMGWVIGSVGERAVTDALRDYQRTRPVDRAQTDLPQSAGAGSPLPAGRTITA